MRLIKKISLFIINANFIGTLLLNHCLDILCSSLKLRLVLELCGRPNQGRLV